MGRGASICCHRVKLELPVRLSVAKYLGPQLQRNVDWITHTCTDLRERSRERCSDCLIYHSVLLLLLVTVVTHYNKAVTQACFPQSQRILYILTILFKETSS